MHMRGRHTRTRKDKISACKSFKYKSCYLHSNSFWKKRVFKTFPFTLLTRVAKDEKSSLLWRHKRYDFNAANFRRHSRWKCALQTQWIGIRYLTAATVITFTHSLIICNSLVNKYSNFLYHNFCHDNLSIVAIVFVLLFRKWNYRTLYLSLL